MTELQTHPVHALDSRTLSSARWRRLALSGAAVGSAAASSAAMGAVVQVTQVGNEVTSLANNLRADLTGDGVSDLPGLSAGFGPTTSVSGGNWYYRNRAAASFNPPGPANYQSLGWAGYVSTGTGIVAFTNTTNNSYRNAVGSNNNNPSKDSSGMVPISFTDARVNGGATTNALLEVRAFSTSTTSHTMRLVRLVFNDRSTAAPTGAGTTVGSAAPEFATRLAQIATLEKTIAKLTKQLRKADTTKKKAIAKKLKRAKAQLAAL